MKEELISSVSGILIEWNPVGDKAESTRDLEGYRYEAMDILSAIQITKVSAEKAVRDVLTQAFSISLDEAKRSLMCRIRGTRLGCRKSKKARYRSCIHWLERPKYSFID